MRRDGRHQNGRSGGLIECVAGGLELREQKLKVADVIGDGDRRLFLDVEIFMKKQVHSRGRLGRVPRLEGVSGGYRVFFVLLDDLEGFVSQCHNEEGASFLVPLLVAQEQVLGRFDAKH